MKPVAPGHLFGGALTVVAIWGFLTASDTHTGLTITDVVKARQSPRCNQDDGSPDKVFYKYKASDAGMVSSRSAISSSLDRDGGLSKPRSGLGTPVDEELSDLEVGLQGNSQRTENCQ